MREYIAAQCVRFDTVVAVAFQKALGLYRGPRGDGSVRISSKRGAYKGLMECFNQKHGVRL